MKFYYRHSVSISCLVLALLMARASIWQAERHTAKQAYIKALEERLAQPPVPMAQILREAAAAGVDRVIHRRVLVSGTYDFSNEMVLRNRRYHDDPGVYALTPLALDDSVAHVIVTRGFIPLGLSSPQQRTQFQKLGKVSFTALIKESSFQKFLAPSDPPSGPTFPWVDGWLRVDIARMQAQIPYTLLPFFLEIMTSDDLSAEQERMIQTKSGKEEMLMLSPREHQVSIPITVADREYPIPVFDTVIPPGRHFGYIFEWGFMSLITILIGIILQLRPPRNAAET